MIAANDCGMPVELAWMQIWWQRLMTRNCHLCRLLTYCLWRLTLIRQRLWFWHDASRRTVHCWRILHLWGKFRWSRQVQILLNLSMMRRRLWSRCKIIKIWWHLLISRHWKWTRNGPAKKRCLIKILRLSRTFWGWIFFCGLTRLLYKNSRFLDDHLAKIFTKSSMKAKRL